MDAALLDTDTLSEIVKQRSAAIRHNASSYLGEYGQFTFSVFTRFEIARGYKEKRATRQLAQFEAFCKRARILPLTDVVFEKAADLWVLARQNGQAHGDADILIAATALEHQLVLATGNTAHFKWIPGLKVVNWRKD
jgi:tRNA(fMet)-specific endonuclease VapC